MFLRTLKKNSTGKVKLYACVILERFYFDKNNHEHMNLNMKSNDSNYSLQSLENIIFT